MVCVFVWTTQIRQHVQPSEDVQSTDNYVLSVFFLLQ